MNAWDELKAYLCDGEELEAIAVGRWGDCTSRCSQIDDDYSDPKRGYEEPERSFPADLLCRVLDTSHVQSLIESTDDWSFDGGFGSSACHPVHVWTNQRVIFVHEYDGSTCLASVPRHPKMGCVRFNGAPEPE